MPATPRSGTGRSSQFVDASYISFGFAGTISTDQNANIIPVDVPFATRVTRFRVGVVSPGLGGNVVVKFYVNAVEVASVTLLAGETTAETLQTVDIPANARVTCEIDSMTTTTPPTTMAMAAV